MVMARKTMMIRMMRTHSNRRRRPPESQSEPRATVGSQADSAPSRTLTVRARSATAAGRHLSSPLWSTS
jgi:hypothetical protein